MAETASAYMEKRILMVSAKSVVFLPEHKPTRHLTRPRERLPISAEAVGAAG